MDRTSGSPDVAKRQPTYILKLAIDASTVPLLRDQPRRSHIRCLAGRRKRCGAAVLSAAESARAEAGLSTAVVPPSPAFTQIIDRDDVSFTSHQPTRTVQSALRPGKGVRYAVRRIRVLWAGVELDARRAWLPPLRRWRVPGDTMISQSNSAARTDKMASLLRAAIAVTVFVSVRAHSCRAIPGDAAWPSQDDWSQLNSTLGGKLIASVPAASVCHDPNYDAEACAVLKANWDSPLPQHVLDPPLEPPLTRHSLNIASEIMDPLFQNQSCVPYTPQSTPCELGNYVSYSIDIESAEDVRTALRFAKAKNVRLVIKNTGHE